MKFIMRIVISFIALLLSVASIAQTYPNKPCTRWLHADDGQQ